MGVMQGIRNLLIFEWNLNCRAIISRASRIFSYISDVVGSVEMVVVVTGHRLHSTDWVGDARWLRCPLRESTIRRTGGTVDETRHRRVDPELQEKHTSLKFDNCH